MTKRQKVVCFATLSFVVGVLITPLPVLRTIIGLAWLANCAVLFASIKEGETKR